MFNFYFLSRLRRFDILRFEISHSRPAFPGFHDLLSWRQVIHDASSEKVARTRVGGRRPVAWLTDSSTSESRG